MNGLTLTVAIVGLITSTIAIFTSLLKIVNVINTLKNNVNEANWKIQALQIRVETGIKTLETSAENQNDAITLTVNGVRERLEHVTERTQTYVQKNAALIEDIESWLQKHTEYERRSNR